MKGTGLLVLLGFAAGCAFGLFFGWLLHRERVERALYEDVVRTRDRATATLAETSARLELANKDMVRLRGQLTNAQHLLAERDATIGELEDELAALEAGHARDEPSADEPIDVAADTATTPDEVRMFDDADLDDDHDITEEVPLSAVKSAGGLTGERDEPGLDTVAVDEEAGRAGVAEPAHVTGEEPALAKEPAAGEEPAEPAAGEEPAEPVVEEPAEPVVEEPAEPAAGEEPAEPAAGEEPAEPVVEEPAEPVVEEPPAGEELPGGEPPEDAEIGVPLVLEADAPSPEPDVTDDDLQRISGVGPALERQLRAEGIRTYRQLALLDDAAIAELEARSPRLVTRLRRGGWVAQARRLHVESYGTPP